MSDPDTTEPHQARILVVEDNFLVAEMIADDLRDRGCNVVGPVSRLDQGLALANSEPLDGALLDVNLYGERCFPIADALATRSIPYAFLTGYDDGAIPPEYRGAPRLPKPFETKELATLIADCFLDGG